MGPTPSSLYWFMNKADKAIASSRSLKKTIIKKRREGENVYELILSYHVDNHEFEQALHQYSSYVLFAPFYLQLSSAVARIATNIIRKKLYVLSEAKIK